MLITGQRILVTGGTGFLGRHLLPLLLQKGAKVTCLVRSPQATLPAGAMVVRGDCTSVKDVATAMRGQDVVIHMAGVLFGGSWQNYLKINGRMAENLATSAQANQIGQFIFISSLAAAGPWADAPGRSEAMPPAPVSAYGWSKLLAENILSAALGRNLAVLRPPIIYGSGDRGLLPLFRACGHGLSVGRNFRVSAIHADDCARAIVHLAENNSRGIYHVTDGQIYRMDDFSRAMALAQGREKINLIHPPLPLMAMTAALADGAHAATAALRRLLRRPAPRTPQWNRDKYLEAAQIGWVADGSRLAREGFQAQMTLKDGMAEAVAFYRREGWL